ncbi:MAG: hypothetical protein WAV89_01305 [Ignavibacteriaceae bacterium]
MQFAKLINTSPELSLCWKQAKIKGTSAYHRIIKHNLHFTKDGLLTVTNHITPAGFDFNPGIVMAENYQLLFNMDFKTVELNKFYKLLNVFNIIFLSNQNQKTIV